tara:strand:+ start:70 stop:558 length:489 start_codon:yes stop_codon:yes gene_type:complete
LNISRLVGKNYIRLFLIVTLFPLQSCSNTFIGEKLENSFDTTSNSTNAENISKVKVQNTLNQIKRTKLNKNDDVEENVQADITKNNSISNEDRFSQKSTKLIKKVIFDPQPYRIILRLSGANPSAPAETVTNTLRKAGVQFEVEKIERLDENILFKDSSLKR